MSLPSEIYDRGWVRYPEDTRSVAWAQTARRVGRRVVADPEMRAKWLQCEGTWFVGVDALPTDPQGAIDDVPLCGPAIDALGPLPKLHRAQLSVTYPGYPRPRTGESDASFRYRLKRDAAHVDGILPVGSTRRRFVLEPHAFVLGVCLTTAEAGAAPLVVWDGSHHIMRDALAEVLRGHEDLAQVDVTDAYQMARKTCFAQCVRRPLALKCGEAVLVHPLTLHGIAPWTNGAAAPADGRMMAYFRPLIQGGVAAWLEA